MPPWRSTDAAGPDFAPTRQRQIPACRHQPHTPEAAYGGIVGEGPLPDPLAPPDLSARRFNLTVERVIAASPHVLIAAWTRGFDRWFAAPGSVPMDAWVDRLSSSRLCTGTRRVIPSSAIPTNWWKSPWVTRKEGTQGAETVVTVELEPRDGGSFLRLMHAGFPDARSCGRHRQAWPLVLAQLNRQTKDS